MLGIGEPTYRLLTEDEIPAARAHLERLDTEDMFHHFHRFMAPEDFDDWAARAATHDLIGCFGKGLLIGLAEIAYDGADAEIALSVDAGMRQRGIGTELFARACARAAERGALHAMVLITRGDRPMIDMAVRFEGYTAYRRGESILMPGAPHSLLRWLVFDLEHLPPRDVFGKAVHRVRVALGLEQERTTANLRSRD